MNARKEDIRAWLGAIVLHGVLALILFLWKLDLSASEPEYVEVRWESASDVSRIMPARPSRSKPESIPRINVASKAKPTAKSMDLPQRRFATDEDVLRLPSAHKIAAEDEGARQKPQFAPASEEKKEGTAGTGRTGDRKLTAPGVGEKAGEIADPMGPGGNQMGKSVSMSMQWSDGGTRKKISGVLPEYPAGAGVEAQIKIEITVLPDGAVKSLRPAQKGNMKLEEAAMKETRFWRFEPLLKSTPQRDQTCLVTFNFQLR